MLEWKIKIYDIKRRNGLLNCVDFVPVVKFEWNLILPWETG